MIENPSELDAAAEQETVEQETAEREAARREAAVEQKVVPTPQSKTDSPIEQAGHPLQLRGAQVVFVVLLAALMAGQWLSLSSNGTSAAPSSANLSPVESLARSPICINLNTASESELTLLPGLGDKLVRDLVAYRDLHGDFGSWADVEAVNGMGPLTIQAIRPWSTLGPVVSATVDSPVVAALPATDNHQAIDPAGLTVWNP